MKFLKIILISIALLFCFNAHAKSKTQANKGDRYLDSLKTINVADALEELGQLEDSSLDEVLYLEGERYISVDELEAVFRKILREEGN